MSTGCHLATDLTLLMRGHRDQAEHPVDTSETVTGRVLTWSANPITTLRPLASDLGVATRGRVQV